MGIYQLNRFIRDNCEKHLQLIKLSEISHKKIVIDASIFMYKFIKDGCIIEGMFHFISKLLHYDITPIFVFDGKPPLEKNIEIENRKSRKRDAYQKYDKLKLALETQGVSAEAIKKNKKLLYYKSIFTTITQDNVNDVKSLLELYGIEYIHAEGEADALCCELVKTNMAWACLSEDTDMFVHGCPRILRYFSLINDTTVLYDMPSIYKELSLSVSQFKELCVMVGTDYNKGYDTVYNLYTKFIKHKQTGTGETMCKILKLYYMKDRNCNNDIDDMKKTLLFFNTNAVPSYKVVSKKKNLAALKSFLQSYNFLFVTN